MRETKVDLKIMKPTKKLAAMRKSVPGQVHWSAKVTHPAFKWREGKQRSWKSLSRVVGLPVSRAATCLAAAFTVYTFAGTPVQASPLYSGTISGQFSGALKFNGTVIDARTGAQFTESSAGGAIVSGINTNRLTFGLGSTGTQPQSSTITFTGFPFSNRAPDTEFDVGRIDFTNGVFDQPGTRGTLDLRTGIFGSALRLNFSMTLGDQVDPRLVPFDIVPTVNAGLDNASSADFLQFGPAVFNTTQPVSLNVLETRTGSAILRGKIVGDPMLELTGLVLAPGSTGAAFIGSGIGSGPGGSPGGGPGGGPGGDPGTNPNPPPRAVPEPTSLTLLGLGLVGLCAASRRRRKT